MNVCVLGLWHLGTVTAACLASSGHEVAGLDFDPAVVSGLAAGRSPIFEPALEELIQAGLVSGRLRFTTDAAQAVKHADVVWVAYDTPVDDDDRADVQYVVDRVARVFPHLRDRTLVLVSSQVPVGTTRELERMFAKCSENQSVHFGYSPENLRLGEAIGVFTKPDRVVVGLRSLADREKVTSLLRPFTDRIEWMSVESAEMTKQALNAFLATSVTFINEIATLCEHVGADATEVERGLKSESRIGPKAYLSPGSAFAGGTLARDVIGLSRLGQTYGVETHLLSSIKVSNDAHRSWAQRRMIQLLGDVSGKTIAVWGLTYKPGTDTLRRSSSLELCEWLVRSGAIVRAHDPAVRALPPELIGLIELAGSPAGALDGASALIVSTPWPQFREVAPGELTSRMIRQLVLDPGRLTSRTLENQAGIEYVSVGQHNG